MPTATELTDEILATIDENAVQVCKADELTREDWLRFRKPYIGGSEAASAIGLNPYQSAYSLWVEKTRPDVVEVDNRFMAWGRRLEEAIGLGISEDTGIPVVRYPYMLASKEWPFAACNCDFLSPGYNPVPSVVEVKNVGGHMAKEWEHGATPVQYGIQGQYMCAVTGLPGVHFFPLIGGNEGRPVFVERNDQLIEDLMTGVEKFWGLVQSETPPAIDGSDSTQRALKSQYMDPDADSVIDLSEIRTFDGLSLDDLLDRRATAKATIKEQEQLASELENQIFAWMGNSEIALVNDEVRLTWKKVYRKGYAVNPSASRRLTVKGTK